MSKLKQYKMFIDGEWVDSESKKTFETLNPENNEPWAKVPEASAKDVDLAVKAAHPELDIRFVFQRNNTLSSKSKTNYGDWCDKHGFKWCIFPNIPTDWFK